MYVDYDSMSIIDSMVSSHLGLAPNKTSNESSPNIGWLLIPARRAFTHGSPPSRAGLEAISFLGRVCGLDSCLGLVCGPAFLGIFWGWTSLRLRTVGCPNHQSSSPPYREYIGLGLGLGFSVRVRDSQLGSNRIVWIRGQYSKRVTVVYILSPVA